MPTINLGTLVYDNQDRFPAVNGDALPKVDATAVIRANPFGPATRNHINTLGQNRSACDR